MALFDAMLSSSLSAFVIRASALAFVKYKFDEPSETASVLNVAESVFHLNEVDVWS